LDFQTIRSKSSKLTFEGAGELMTLLLEENGVEIHSSRLSIFPLKQSLMLVILLYSNLHLIRISFETTSEWASITNKQAISHIKNRFEVKKNRDLCLLFKFALFCS
jgi:hypothetical protein